jgi:hypothetical protein
MAGGIEKKHENCRIVGIQIWDVPNTKEGDGYVNGEVWRYICM